MKSLSLVRLFATPWTIAFQVPPSMGFSRWEHWSGLPFPPPMHESEKWKWSCSVMSDPQRPDGLQPSRLLRPWDFPGKSTGVGCHCLLWNVPLVSPIFLKRSLVFSILLFSSISLHHSLFSGTLHSVGISPFFTSVSLCVVIIIPTTLVSYKE